ncbi:hypothetical protein OPT61_g4862 [Boeremia exigua]|uniref:Uncharacterized protein n=1 Tax=Boeremia exigua TaxID=749465 RepID=A0ACC2ICM1_9PLEO|nr:hypothetical protein OPT61_g4862 [Boeremia exigua]
MQYQLAPFVARLHSFAFDVTQARTWTKHDIAEAQQVLREEAENPQGFVRKISLAVASWCGVGLGTSRLLADEEQNKMHCARTVLGSWRFLVAVLDQSEQRRKNKRQQEYYIKVPQRRARATGRS